MVSEKEALTDKVNLAIEQLRPFLNDDGGDMELVEITAEGIVRVRLLGACSDCSMSMMTLKAGLEEALKSTTPEIKGVEAVD
ncbi:MAG: NifU family protein [Crocinitomicaceae bacterium]|nr:NifU family protein [Crocinitomicaceae bacterium]